MAGKMFLYTPGVRYIQEEYIGLRTGDIKAVLTTKGYSPGTASHSALAQIEQATASSTVVNAISLANKYLTISGQTVVVFKSDNISGFSAGGDQIPSIKYMVFYASGSFAAGVVNPLLSFADLSATSATNVQVDVNMPTGGWFKIKSNE